RSGYAADRMVVIPNGYDLAMFRHDPEAGKILRSTFGLDEAEPVIGLVARFHPLKDHDNLLHALAHLRDSAVRPVCLLAGTGLDHKNAGLLETIDKLGLGEHVRLLGQRSDVPAVMNALDLHVLSSVSEGFPNV